MTTASKAQYRQNLKRLKKALKGEFKTAPTTQSAYVVGDGHIKIDGRYYDAATSGIAGGTATVVNIGRPAAAIYSTAEGGTVITAGGGGSGGTTIIGGTAGAPLNAGYLVIAPDSTLTAERTLFVSTALTMTDTGPNNTLILGMAVPPELSATSTANALTGSHAIAASDAPGATTSLLKSISGLLTLPTFAATTKLRAPLIDTASGDLALAPASGIVTVANDLTAVGTVQGATVIGTTKLRSPLIDTASGNLSIVPAGGTTTITGAITVSTTATVTTSVQVPLLTTATNVDLVINPAGTGAVQFPNDQKLRTSSFDSSFPVTGWQINEVAGIANYSALTIGKIQADELAVRVFVADEVRVDRGDEYWTKSYGIIAAAFTTPSSIGGTVSVMFEDSPALTGAIFSNNDWLLIRKLEIDSGLTLFNVWGQVSSYVNNSDGTQNWTFTLRSGPTSEAITKGSLAIDFGASGAALIHLSVIDAAGAPYIKMRRWAGGNPYTPANYTTYVQLGNLGSIGNSYYTPSGDGIYIRSTASDGQFIVADNNGLQLRGASLTLWDGATQTVNIGNTGTDIWVGTGSSNKILAWNGSALSLRANNTDVITLDTSGNSYFAGVMTIGTSGEIRQGTGTIGSNYTGLRIWRDSSIGRIAGYNNNVQQWYANTDGKLYAGGGTFMADADGIHLGNESYAKGFQLYRSSTFSNSQKAGGLWALSDLGNNVYLYAGRNTGLGDASNANGELSLTAYDSGGDGVGITISGSAGTIGFGATSSSFDHNISIAGNISVSGTVDGVDIAAFKTAYDSHTHNYLPLAGGTLTGTLTARDITFSADNTYDIGASDKRVQDLYVVNLRADNIVGTPSFSHSHDSDYVNVTGDTMSGQLTLSFDNYQMIVLDRTAHASIDSTFYVGVSYLTGVSDDYAFFGKSDGLQVYNDSSVKINGNTIWHAGNDGAGSGLHADLLDGYNASDFALAGSIAPVAATYVVISSDATLTNERSLAVSSALSLTDGGAGSSATIGMAAPGTLTASSTNVNTGNHTHTVTASAAPGAAESLLKSTSGGGLTLVTATATTKVTTPTIDTASGDLALSPASATVTTTNLTGTGTLQGATIIGTTKLRSPLIDTAAGNLSITPAGGTTAITGALTVSTTAAITTSVSTPLLTTASGNLDISPAGDVVLDPAGNDVYPSSNYDLNLGLINKKWLTLHAAELWVETLVAQETIATIGGRILVGPTTTLTSDLASGATTIFVKHNQASNGDRVYLEANGKIEFIAIASAYSGTGPYSYTVTRNLDGTGANDWYAGDAVFNTGQTSNGFIDIYSLYGIPRNGQTSTNRAGPTIVGNVRLSSTYNDFRERWAVGSLNGLYDYSTEVYGFAAGDPTATWVGLDATSGLRMMSNTTKRMEITAAGTLNINNSSGTNVITLDNSGNSYFSGVMTIGASGELRQGTGTLGTDYTGLRIWRDTNVGRIAGYNNNTAQWYAANDGKLYAGGGTFAADAAGIHLANGAGGAAGFQLYRTATFSNSNKAGGLWALSDLGNNVYLYAGRSTGLGDSGNSSGLLDLTAYSSAGGGVGITLDGSSGYISISQLRTETVRPILNNTSDLGTSSYYYNNAYIRNLHIDTIVGTPSYSHSHAATDITSGTLDLARIPTNLTGKNADLLDGYNAADFALAGHTHGTAVASITAGGGITVSGTTAVTISHTDTSGVTDVTAVAGTVLSGMTFDTYGHVQTTTTANLDTRYAQALTAGASITITGTLSGYTIAHTDTSTQANVSNTGVNFIQSMTFDTNGHVTGVTSASLSSALDSVYVNVTGDTMTGDLSIDGDAAGTQAMLGLTTRTSTGSQWRLLSRPFDYATSADQNDLFFNYYNGTTAATALSIDNSTLLATFGGAASVTGTVTATGAGSFASNTDANNILGRGIVGYAAASDSATFAHFDYHTSTNFALAQFSDGSVQVNAPTGQEVALSINDVTTYSVNADRLLPRGSVAVDLGDYNRKIRTIHAAELAVQTLIAQDVIATVGGQIIVSPTSRLIADISSTGTGSGTDTLYTSLISYWSLDEVSGTRSDSKSTNHLADRNTVTSTTGKVGISAVFASANSERLNIADNTALSVGDIDFYCTGWIYATSDDGTTQVVASKGGASGQRAWQLQINWAGSTNRFEFLVYNSSDVSTQVNSAAISVNTWYFVEIWHNATSNQIGIAVNRTQTTASHTTGVKNDTGNFTLGALNSGSNYTGRIDEFGFWKNYIPDTTRRDWLYNSGSGRSYTDIFNYGAGAFNMDLEHNSYGIGDFLYMAAAPGGVPQIEVFKITSASSVITGGYRYSAERNLDGSGANNWYAGDAVTSLGGAVGEGYINLTATSTIHNHYGPTIAHYVRRGTGAWDSVAPVVVSGNLRSFVDYTGDEFGHAAGNDLLLTPSEGFRGYTIDTVNGMRTFNVDISLYEADVQFLSIGTLSGIEIETNDFSTNDNRSISFNRSGVNRSYIRTWEASNLNTLTLQTATPSGIDNSIQINSIVATGQTAFAGMSAANPSGGSSYVALTGLPTANSSAIILQTDGTITLTADLVASNADLDMNGNDIIDTATLSLTSTAQTVLSFSQSNWYLGAISNTDPLINFDSTDYITYSRSSNSFALYIGAASRLLVDASNMGIGGASYGSGVGVVFLANRTTAPTTNPSGGGILYVESGSLKFRGSSGTVTSIAPA